MKKILLPVAALALVAAACNTTPHYEIKGTVEGEETGNVYLLKYKGRQADTLATAPIKAGQFKLSGNAAETDNVYLVVEGKRGGTPVILENAEFTATLNPADNTLSKVEGTENQNVMNQYLAISYNLSKQSQELQKEYVAAKEQGDEAKAQEIENKYEELEKQAEEKQQEIIKNNPDSYVSALMIANQMYNLDLDQLTEAYNKLGANAQASTYGKMIKEKMGKMEAVAIGKTAPDFTQNTPEDKPLSLSDIKGKVKIIDFWASWCGPCRGANPEMVKLYKKYHPKGLEILGVSLDQNKDAWVKAIADDQLEWNQISDLGGWNNAAAQLYAVSSIPHLVILDENNVIVGRNLHGEELEAKVAEMLQ